MRRGLQSKCATAENKSECQASCKACCGGKRDGKCDATPPPATCDTKCENSCQGSCTAKVNIDCQISCQSKLYAECKTKLTGGCKTQCEKPEGALFCDGSYVDTGDNLKSCINALDAYLKAHVDVTASASGSSSCDGGTCTAQGEAKAAATVKGCSMSPDSSANGGVILAGLGIAAVLAGRRRKRAA